MIFQGLLVEVLGLICWLKMLGTSNNKSQMLTLMVMNPMVESVHKSRLKLIQEILLGITYSNAKHK